MASYIVLEPRDAADNRVEKAVVVRDGFSLLAFIMPLLWFLWHRMWWEAAAFFVAGILLAGLGSLSGYEVLAPVLSLLLALLTGLEARALRVAALRRKGYADWGVVEASDADEAEIRYLAEARLREETPGPAPLAAPAPRLPLSGARPVRPAFGLVDYSRKS